MNEIIKSKMKAKTKLYKQYIKNKRFESGFVVIESLVNEINDLVSTLKICIMITLQKNQTIHCCKQKSIGFL